MPKGRLFEYVILYHPKPTKVQQENGDSSKSIIINDIQRVIASDDKQVAMLASRAIPDKYVDQLDQVEIVVRPFLAALAVESSMVRALYPNTTTVSNLGGGATNYYTASALK